MPATPANPAWPALVELELETRGFAGDWSHCDQVANYLAQLVSHDRLDSFLYGNLLSTVLNELLEVLYAHHAPQGSVKCRLLRQGAQDRLELTLPVDAAARDFYARSVEAAQSETVAERYTRWLLGNDTADCALGFLELAADYGARFTFEDLPASGQIRLSVELTLEGDETDALGSATV